MKLASRFSVFSSSSRQIVPAARGSAGRRAVIDVLEERRLMSASVQQVAPAPASPVEMIEMELQPRHMRRPAPSGFEFGSGNVKPIDISGTNGPETFSFAPIDDGFGRDNVHGSGADDASMEALVGSGDHSAPVVQSDSGWTGRFSAGRVLTGNMRPVTVLSASAPAGVFAA